MPRRLRKNRMENRKTTMIIANTRRKTPPPADSGSWTFLNHIMNIINIIIIIAGTHLLYINSTRRRQYTI